jgi:hypothetical protein
MTRLFGLKTQRISWHFTCLVALLVPISLCKAQTFGPWLEPVNVAYPINTEFNDNLFHLGSSGGPRRRRPVGGET